MRTCEHCGAPIHETHREGCPYWHDATPKPPAPLLEILPLQTCQRDVPYDRDEDIACGNIAEYRLSYDGGKTWFYLCDEHAAELGDKEGGAS